MTISLSFACRHLSHFGYTHNFRSLHTTGPLVPAAQLPADKKEVAERICGVFAAVSLSSAASTAATLWMGTYLEGLGCLDDGHDYFKIFCASCLL